MKVSRTAVVTGAAGGIGLATARRLVSDGFEVWAVDVKPPPADAVDGRITFVQADLADATAPTRFFAEHLGDRALSALVNAAGVAFFGRDVSALDADEGIWSTTLGINLGASRRMAAAALPHLRRASSASIVHVASIAGLRNMDSPMDAYQVSKSALVSLSKSLAVQLGPEGIRSNTVCPGAILTPMISFLYDEDPSRKVRMENKTPMRRVGLPQDVAAAVSWLVSDDASFVTGIDLIVDGGWSAVTV